ncbi:Heavy metal-associated isoprenylated plant protein 19 [Camellia lanceoleosa]|uniref:Heavy metal-associated isoprenylated plant protein 19 n=1 Tax=Camellia lanceoleosa TaxID=1840588 RepID=A0ACC0HIF0_9ERIC|nr:Heavy metal-associated isoprenylated plant protein 19 [Camellia lanceoleosa]
MAGDKKDNEDKVVVVEFNVSMHCNACERTVAKTISKIKGVEKFVTDMRRHRVIVTGRVNPDKVLKKLKKKTGKRVEIVINKEDPKGESKEEDSSSLGGFSNQITRSMVLGFCGESMVYTMFSDENANACSIM